MRDKAIIILRAAVVCVLVPLLLILLPACAPSPPPEAAEPPATHTPQEEGSSPDVGESLEQLVTTPTPAPTATPGLVDEVVSDVVQATGLSGTTFLGLTVEDWINLGFSVLVVLFGFTLGGRLVLFLLRRILKSTPTEWDVAFLKEIETQVRWFVGVLGLQFATRRLVFLSPTGKQTWSQLYFGLYLLIVIMIAWKLIDFAVEWYNKQGETEKIENLLPLVQRIARIALILVGITMFLGNLGVDVTGLVTVLGLGGLALSLAAQDTLADMISGMILYLDQPFRIGDRIEIQDLGTWGDVVEIGTRTTRIRTRDNRMVIIPNSKISKSQVVNYTFPDPKYRVQIDLGVAYGTDIDKVQQIILDTLSQVEGVLKDRPVDVLYNEMGDSAMIIRVRWWIESYEDTRRIFDRVNRALQNALDEAGVEMPFKTLEVSLKTEPESN